MNYYYILKKLTQKTPINVIRQTPCFSDLKNIQKTSDDQTKNEQLNKLVNAGGFSVNVLYSKPSNLSFTEGATTPLGRGS